ncbi:tail fiber domain-containing protein [Haloferula sp.]|uniref:tail fiber domain-containing protein n=1 Tax=Haloferula sp. TaxID=2497595 RepID=UPI003C73DA17
MKHINHTFLSLLLVAGFALLAPNLAQGQINYQGRLTNAVGAPLTDGQYPIQFSLWTAAVDGEQIWGPYILDGSTDPGHGPLADLVNSRFNVIIGSRDTADRSLTTSMATTPTAYLEIKVGSDAPISPRQIILPAPRALTADIADAIPNVTPDASGVNITGELRVPNTLKVGQIDNTNRILTKSVEFWEAGGRGALFQQGNSVFSSASAAPGELVLRTTIGKLHLQTGNTSAMTIDTANRVGIGTTTPTQAKLVVKGNVSGSAAGDSGYAYVTSFPAIDGRFINQVTGKFSSDVGPTIISGTVNGIPAPSNAKPATSIYADGAIWSGTALVSSSDERIKSIEGCSDGAKDLDTLVGIEVTDYHYKDVIGKGSVPQKKVVAQQVEKVYPQAVSLQTDVVPDIYQIAKTKDGWVELATDLKMGERVKLISGKEEGIHEVLEIAEGRFRTAFKSEDDKLFVYGREVNDFRTVDYDAIAMLNVSATQELARRLEAQRALLAAKDAEVAQLREENDKLTRKVTVLDSRDQLFEARLIRLEKSSASDARSNGMNIQTAATE